MGIVVRSPYDGEQVKVRDQDAGRAVKDRQGRIFYVLPKSDGSGYYGAITRAGGSKDEARALEFENKEAQRRGNVHEQVEEIHDARGKKRSSIRGKLVILLFVIVVALFVYLFIFGPFKLDDTQRPRPLPPGDIPMGAGR